MLSPLRRVMKVFGLLRRASAGAVLLFLMMPAHADRWSVRAAEPHSRAPWPVAELLLAPARDKAVLFFDIFPAYKAVRHHLRAAAQDHGVDAALLQAIISVESGFDAKAVSPKGAVGLMQLMPETAARFGVVDQPHASAATLLTNPGLNIRAGSRYLSYLLQLFPGQIELAVAAYNAGEGAVRRAGNQVPDFRETQRYVKSVMDLYTLLRPPAKPLTSTYSTFPTEID